MTVTPAARRRRGLPDGWASRLAATEWERLRAEPFEELGRAALVVLFVVVPFLNPGLVTLGTERVYLGTALAALAGLLALPRVFAVRPRWVLLALLVAVEYALAVAVLRGVTDLGVLANVYRPLQAPVTFVACAVLLTPARARRWLSLFLAGGVAGCGLAVVQTLVSGIDLFPFSSPGPDFPFEARYSGLGGSRESGAFIYPNNLGTYAAYVVIVGAVAATARDASRRVRLLGAAAVPLGALAVLVSSARSAAAGLAVGVAVLVVQRPAARRLVLVAVAAIAAFAAGAAVTGRLGDFVQTRFGSAGDAFSGRVDSWRASWHAFRALPLLGAGLAPNTIDSTLFYLLYVGGLVGLLLVATLIALTLLRPLLSGDRRALPLLVVALVSAVLQDTIGQPLTSWALGAGVFLLSPIALDAPVTLGRGRVRPVLDRLRGGRSGWAVAVAALVAANVVVFGAAAALGDLGHTDRYAAGPSARPKAPDGRVAGALQPIALGSVRRVDPHAAVAIDHAARRRPVRFWVLGNGAEPAMKVVGNCRFARDSEPGCLNDVLRMPVDGRAALLAVQHGLNGSVVAIAHRRPGGWAASVFTVFPTATGVGTARSRTFFLPSGATPAFVALAPASGSGTRDLFVGLTRGARSWMVVRGAAGGFAFVDEQIPLPRSAFRGAVYATVQVVDRPLPDLVVVRRDGRRFTATVYRGETRFRRSLPPRTLAVFPTTRFMAGRLDGEPALYALTENGDWTYVEALQLPRGAAGGATSTP